jgi:preprotein translocase subunit SecE
MKTGNFNGVKFLTEVQEELKKVSWPSKNETIRLTTIVVVTSAIAGTFLGMVDLLYTKIFSVILKI